MKYLQTAIFLSLIYLTLIPVECSNLLLNPGFEQGDMHWKLTDTSITIDPAGGRNSGAALKLSWPEPTHMWTAMQEFPVHSGCRYLLRGWMKSDAIEGAWWAPAFLSVEFGGPKGFDWNDSKLGVLGVHRADGIRGVNDWTEVIFITPPAPENTCRGRITASIDWNAYGTAWVDDLSISEIPESEICQWHFEPQEITGAKNTPEMSVVIDSLRSDLLPGEVEIAVALCAPTWNKELRVIKQSYIPGMRLSFSTADLEPGLWRFRLTLRDAKTGRYIMEPELKSFWKNPPFSVVLKPHTGVLTLQDAAPEISVTAHQTGQMQWQEEASDGQILKSGQLEINDSSINLICLTAPQDAGNFKVNLLLTGTDGQQYKDTLTYSVLSDKQAAKAVRVGPGKFLLRENKPWLPVFMLANAAIQSGAWWDGLQEQPQRNPEREQQIIDRLKNTGIGVMDWATPLGGLEATRDFADKLAANNIPWGLCLRDIYPAELGAWGGFTRRSAGFPGMSREDITRQLVREFRDHPALRFWYINDEMGTEYTSLLREMRNWIMQEDVTHPTVASYQDFEPLAPLARGMDILTPELYAWRHSDEPAQMAQMMAQINTVIPPDMMTWANVIWLSESYPLYQERFRAGVWIALARGCRGVLIDGVGRVQKDEEWEWLRDFSAALQKWSPVILQPAGPDMKADNPEVITGTFTGPEGLWLMVVNGTRNELKTTVSIPNEITQVKENDKSRFMQNNKLHLNLRPYGVRIFKLQ